MAFFNPRASSLFREPIREGRLDCDTLAAQSWVRRHTRRTFAPVLHDDWAHRNSPRARRTATARDRANRNPFERQYQEPAAKILA